MKKIIRGALWIFAVSVLALSINKACAKVNKVNNSIYDFSAKTIEGTDKQLSDYKGKVILVVNVASKCGFTPQYKGLEQLYRTYKDQGFVILGFPCNQFGSQEPGTEKEIAQFCSLNYDVSFPMFAKIDVNGEAAHPLYKYLTSSAPGLLGTEAIKWNFTKFLIDRNGKIVERYASQTTPESISAKIKELVSAK